MDPLVGTAQCPHLGFGAQDGLPCCHADDVTRSACGKFAPNPKARNAATASGIEAYFCTVLGSGSLPAEALRLAQQEKARARQAAQPQKSGYRPPSEVTGQMEGRPERAQDAGSEPVIPTHTLRQDARRIAPNAPCPCGSGKKFKKCCGR